MLGAYLIIDWLLLNALHIERTYAENKKSIKKPREEFLSVFGAINEKLYIIYWKLSFLLLRNLLLR
jgi:hypothetical protein